ncbi:hypothetical protein [Hymenobacter sediminicola]|uniref:Secreted protein n=1 Tax=Hymenobacter sediminicola TaxID=2761579 RepID=A0A7G7W4L9_9BACT|nr:hypothetical protein [Hymenobacter sediminicola]QNH61312.1 hypothetical protein H4317_14235 [Hymenobacter sediminicola]
MLRNPLTWLLFLIVSTALAACCGSVACDCQDSLDDAVYFNFNLSSTAPNRLDSAAVDTVFFVRQLLPYRDTVTTGQPAIDTIQLLRVGRERGTSVVLNNAQPFGQRGTRKLNQYSYKLYLGKRRAPTASFVIDSIQLEDQLKGDGCCTCNSNVKKLVFLRGTPTPIDASDPSGQDQAVPVTLNR